MHRSPIPTTNAIGLLAHVLWIMSERMVLVAGFPGFGQQTSSLHLSIMSSLSPRHKAQCHCHNTPRHVFAGEPAKAEDRRGGRRIEAEV